MIMDKKQPKIKWPQRKAKAMKKMPDGNPYPYEQAEMADGGVTEPEVSDGIRPGLKYTPKPTKNIGDDGLGGHK